MSSNELTPDRPVFKTPDPEELQSEENQAAMRAQINEEQSAEDGDLDSNTPLEVNEQLNSDQTF